MAALVEWIEPAPRPVQWLGQVEWLGQQEETKAELEERIKAERIHIVETKAKLSISEKILIASLLLNVVIFGWNVYQYSEKKKA